VPAVGAGGPVHFFMMLQRPGAEPGLSFRIGG
jgi:hypothetical protein